jgi:hypothetical protein
MKSPPLEVKRYAEIGVFEGITARNILSKHPDIEEYWGIDPYVPYETNGGPRINEQLRSDDDWNELYIKVCMKMSRYPNFTMLRMTSENASKYFEDGYFDRVYIDGNHIYESVKTDIECWLPKIRKGGLMGGHDYGVPEFPGIKQAVDELLKEPTVLSKTVWSYQVV